MRAGFVLHPDHQEGFLLSQMWENHVLNLIWKISSLPWKGGEAVVRSIIHQGTLENVKQESAWLGKRFAHALDEDLSDQWKIIVMDTLADFDMSQFATIADVVKNVHLDKSELNLKLVEPSLEAPHPYLKMLPPREATVTKDLSEDHYENRTSESSMTQSIVAPNQSSMNQSIVALNPITSGGRGELSGSPDANRCIAGVRRILRRIRDIADSDKHSEDFKRSQIQRAFESLDRMSDSGNVKITTEQWTELENLTLEVEQENQQNLQALKELDVKANNKHQLPRGSLGKFAGSATNFLEFRKNMESLLSNYSSEDLKLSTLRQCIEGPEKKQILKRIENSRNLEHAFQILEQFYGCFNILLPKLKRTLEDLPSNPWEDIFLCQKFPNPCSLNPCFPNPKHSGALFKLISLLYL